MLDDSAVRRSAAEVARGWLESPDPSYGWSGGFTVYDEAQMRQVNAGSLTPVRPCVFLVDAQLRPTQAALPMVQVDLEDYDMASFELGNDGGSVYNMAYNVYGRNRGERDDLSRFLAENLRGARVINLYRYSSGSASLFEVAQLGEVIGVSRMSIKDDDIRQESSLDLWKVVEFQIHSRY